MKREILFRGKKVNSGKWVEGSLIFNPDYKYPLIGNCYAETEDGFPVNNWHEFEVIPETVGQFTGLTDKNGVKIFESDIIRILYSDWTSKSDSDSRTLDQYLNDISKIGKVVYDSFQFGIAINSDKFNEDIVYSPEHGKYGFIEVIGNIYDNSELLK